MSVNVVVLDGVVSSLSLKYDAQGKPELRFTLTQTDPATGWTSYWPCCAVGAAAERLGSELEDGMAIVITSGKLCYRKRQTKLGEQSRMEILVWTADRLSESPRIDRSDDAAASDSSDERSMRPEAQGQTPPRPPLHPCALKLPLSPGQGGAHRIRRLFTSVGHAVDLTRVVTALPRLMFARPA